MGERVAFTSNGYIICLFTANGYLSSVTVNLREQQSNVPCVSYPVGPVSVDLLNSLSH